MKHCLIKFLKELRKKLHRYTNTFKIFILAFFVHNGYSQDVLKSLLRHSHNISTKQNISMLRKEILKTNNEIHQNRYPSVSLSLGDQVNFGRSFDPISGEITPRDTWFHNSNFLLKIQQKVRTMFPSKLDIAIYKTDISILELTDKESQKKIDIEIIKNYYDCIISKENLELSLFMKDNLLASFEGYKKLYDLNKIDILSFLKYKKQLIYLDQEIEHEFSNYVTTYNRLKRIVGLNELNELALNVTENVTENNALEIFNFVKGEMLVEKRLLQKKIELDSLTYIKSKKDLFPEVSFYSSIGSYYSSTLDYQYNFADQIILNNFFNFGIKIDLPLYSKEKKNMVRINKLNSELFLNQSKLQIIETEAFWKEISLEYNNGLKFFYTISKIKNISYKEFYLKKSLYESNKLTITEFLKSYNDLNLSCKEYLHVKYNLLKQRDVLKLVFEHI